MNAALSTQLSVAALICSGIALFVSLLAAFPGLKVVLSAVRDGVLWLALFLILGGVAFVVGQNVPKLPKTAGVVSSKAGPASSLP
jgi:drug/metabolite transporter (DMT)-like permease